MSQLANQQQFSTPTPEEIRSWSKNIEGIQGKYIFVKSFIIRVKAIGTGRELEGEGDGKITLKYNVGDIVMGVKNTPQTLVSTEKEFYFVTLKNGAIIPSSVLKEYFTENMPTTNPKEDLPKDIKDKVLNEIKEKSNQLKKYITTKNVVYGAIGFLALVGLIKIVK